jgi:formate hydrogenlyase subunit 3/multisubunit Na+/H+ antiporter MnhD subunit
VGLLATAAATACLENHGKAIATLPALPAFLAGMMLTVLAGDGITLLVGFELMSIASFTLVVTAYHDGAVRSAGLLYLGMAGLGAVCLVAVVAVLGDADFTVIRAHPPQGWRAVAVLVLVLIGAGSKAGLAPLHIWLPAAHAAAPGPVSALMSGAMTSVALYVLIRVLFDLAGAGQPAWWAMMEFLGELAIGLAYAWHVGALEWE